MFQLLGSRRENLDSNGIVVVAIFHFSTLTFGFLPGRLCFCKR